MKQSAELRELGALLLLVRAKFLATRLLDLLRQVRRRSERGLRKVDLEQRDTEVSAANGQWNEKT